MPVYSRGRDRFDIWWSESPDLIHWGNSYLVAGVETFPFANDKIGPGAPLLAPEADYETKARFRTNVIFPTGAIPAPDGRLRIYYGASDTAIALTEAKIDDLIALCLEGKQAE